MITVNNVGGATLSAAVVAAEKAGTIRKSEHQTTTGSVDSTNADLSASVAAYLSLPGFNAPSALQNDTTDTTTTAADKASAVVKAVSESDDSALKDALKQFDEGLKKLVNRPETQIYQGTLSADATADDLPAPDPLPGVNENGVLGVSEGRDDMAADTNKDGKVSEEERIRYQMPLTYRSSQAAAAATALTDGPSAFSLTEANRAYGVVATATEAA